MVHHWGAPPYCTAMWACPSFQMVRTLTSPVMIPASSVRTPPAPVNTPVVVHVGVMSRVPFLPPSQGPHTAMFHRAGGVMQG